SLTPPSPRSPRRCTACTPRRPGSRGSNRTSSANTWSPRCSTMILSCSERSVPFTDEQATHALTVLTRLAQREQDVGEWILDALRRDPVPFVGPPVRVAAQTGHPTGTLLP